MLLKALHYGYRIPKPRKFTPGDLSLLAYRREMRQTRRKLISQANDYQDRIENQFLQQRKERTLQKHRDNETQYRTQIIMNGYLLSKDLQQWKKEDEIRDMRLQNFVHTEQLRKMNRDRILKILNYESQNFWLNEESMEQRLTENSIFPEELGSTEYYHHLARQTLAYEEMDFEGMEKVMSDEQATTYKNRLLIPLFNQFVTVLKEVKSNPYRNNENAYKADVEEIKALYNDELFKNQREVKLAAAKEKYEHKKKELLAMMDSQDKKDKFIRDKLLSIRKLLAYWRRYTTVLNLTATQINFMETEEKFGQKMKVELSHFSKSSARVKEMKKDVFMSTNQKNTDEEQIDLEQFYKDGTAPSKPIYENPNAEQITKLDTLLEDAQEMIADIPEPRKYEDSLGIGLAEVAEKLRAPVPDIKIEEKDRFKDNTSVMIQTWKGLTKNDEIKRLLDEVGEVQIDQAHLFWKVWEMH